MTITSFVVLWNMHLESWWQSLVIPTNDQLSIIRPAFKNTVGWFFAHLLVVLLLDLVFPLTPNTDGLFCSQVPWERPPSFIFAIHWCWKIGEKVSDVGCWWATFRLQEERQKLHFPLWFLVMFWIADMRAISHSRARHHISTFQNFIRNFVWPVSRLHFTSRHVTTCSRWSLHLLVFPRLVIVKLV